MMPFSMATKMGPMMEKGQVAGDKDADQRG